MVAKLHGFPHVLAKRFIRERIVGNETDAHFPEGFPLSDPGSRRHGFLDKECIELRARDHGCHASVHAHLSEDAVLDAPLAVAAAFNDTIGRMEIKLLGGAAEIPSLPRFSRGSFCFSRSNARLS
jgi:hypothetical protein